MSAHGYNPAFLARAQAKRELADLRRAIDAERQEAERLRKAAVAAVDAIYQAAFEEARLIMARAYESGGGDGAPKKPVAEIVGEVAREFSVAPSLMRQGGLIRGARRVVDARRVAITRTWRERPDLCEAEVARLYRCAPSTVRRIVGGGGG